MPIKAGQRQLTPQQRIEHARASRKKWRAKHTAAELKAANKLWCFQNRQRIRQRRQARDERERLRELTSRITGDVKAAIAADLSVLTIEQLRRPFYRVERRGADRDEIEFLEGNLLDYIDREDMQFLLEYGKHDDREPS